MASLVTQQTPNGLLRTGSELGAEELKKGSQPVETPRRMARRGSNTPKRL